MQDYSSIRTVFIVFILPVLFAITGILAVLYLDKSLTIDGYIFLDTSQALLDGYGYTGIFAAVYPPLYTLLVSFLGLFVKLEYAAKMITVLSAAGLLSLLPLYSNRTGNSYIPGLVVQVILVSNPSFFLYSTQAESHMLEAFLFVLAIYCLFVYLDRKRQSWFVCFLGISLLACLTRYTSWVLIVAFVIWIVISSAERQKWLRLRQLTVVFLVFYTPWLAYSYFWNGFVISSFRWSILGESMIQNGLMNITTAEWFHFVHFRYSGAFDFILEHPVQVGINYLINVRNILALYLYDFPPLGVFAPATALGVLAVTGNSRSDSKRLYLLLVTLVFTVLAAIAPARWIYFIHLVPLLATMGIQSVYRIANRWNLSVNQRNISGILVVSILLLGGMSYDFNRLKSHYRYHVATGFRIPKTNSPRLKTYVERQLRSYRKNRGIPKGARSMMTLSYAGQIYRAGFKPIFASLPKASPLEVLCFTGLSRQRFQFYETINFPPNISKSRYVPPDYFLVSKNYRWIVNRRKQVKFVDFLKYMSPVKQWKAWNGIELYKIDRESLHCPSG